MKTPKLPFILFFVNGIKLTPAEAAEAAKIRGRVGYRNATVVGDDDVPEICDGVAGKVPKPYSKFPTAKQAVEAYDKQLEAATKLVGDSPPKAPKNDNKNAEFTSGEGDASKKTLPSWPGGK